MLQGPLITAKEPGAQTDAFPSRREVTVDVADSDCSDEGAVEGDEFEPGETQSVDSDPPTEAPDHTPRNSAAIDLAFQSLAATKLRTGAPARKVDFDRVVKKFALSSTDAAELEAQAENALILEEEDLVEATGPEPGFDDDVVRVFLDETKRYPLLGSEEHQQLARAIVIGRDAERALMSSNLDSAVRERLERHAAAGRTAHDRFVSGNVRLVVSVAKRYLGRGLDFADLIQEGCLGLIHAVDKWDAQQGTQFSTYAYYWIMQSISRAIAEKSRLIRLPVHAHDALNQIRRAIRTLSFRFGREATYAEVAEHLNFPVEKVAALAQWLRDTVSLESRIGEDGDAVLGDLIPSHDGTVEEQVTDRERDRNLRGLMERHLNARQIDVLNLRFGMNGRPMTLEQVGAEYGLTRERIRQIEAKALKILKNRIQKDRLAASLL